MLPEDQWLMVAMLSADTEAPSYHVLRGTLAPGYHAYSRCGSSWLPSFMHVQKLLVAMLPTCTVSPGYRAPFW